MRAISNKLRWQNHVGRSLTLTRGRLRSSSLRRELIWLSRWSASLSRARIYADDKYWNFKIPVSSGLAQEAVRSPRLERQVLRLLLLGAENLRSNHALEAFPNARVAALVTTQPDYFSSEVTVFLNSDYYQQFTYDESQLNGAISPLERHNIELPQGFSAWGTRFSYHDDWSGRETTEEHWTFGEQIKR